MSASEPTVDELREELHAAAQIEHDVERTLTVIGVVTAALRPWHLEPVLVGGMAVWFWVETDEFSTLDIDVVVDAPQAAEQLIERLGFVRSRDDRHWEIPGTRVVLEIPERRLDAGSEVVRIETAPGRSAAVLSLVDVLMVRLQELQADGHRLVALQTLALIAQVEVHEQERLRVRAEAARVASLLAKMVELNDALSAGGSHLPESDEFHAFARQSRVTDLGFRA